MCCCILVCAHCWPRNGRNNVLIGLPDLVKERKLSKIVINRRLPNIYYYISREFPIQNFQSPATIVTANTVTRLS